MRIERLALAASATLVIAGSAGAQQQEPAGAFPVKEESSVTHHTAKVGGQTISYTATAATYVIRDDHGAPKATFFFVAYTKDGVDEPATRPVAFVYNGGPGSASLFTHMGMGPRRVVLTADGHGMPAPYRIEDNRDSYLDATDLVFIDAIGTGYSRPVPGEDRTQFYGTVPGRELLCGLHLPVRNAQRALGFAQVPDRRKLRNDPLGRARGHPPAPSRDVSQRHRARLRRGVLELG